MNEEKSLSIFEPTNVNEAVQFCEKVTNSLMCPKAYAKKPEDALVALMYGMEIGLKPMQCLQNICCINGRPSLYGDALPALVRKSGLCEYIKESFDKETMTATCTVKRVGEEPHTEVFDRSEAQAANLWTNPGPWKQYPRRMLKMRARSWALRDVFADVLGGISIVEEAQDIPAERVINEVVTTNSDLEKELLGDDNIEDGVEVAKTAEVIKDAEPVKDDLEAVVDTKLKDELAEKIGYCESTSELNALVKDMSGLSDADLKEMRVTWKARLIELQS